MKKPGHFWPGLWFKDVNIQTDARQIKMDLQQQALFF
jgi:hypothetical protein